MQEIIILNDLANISAMKLSLKENKPVLLCFRFSDYGILFKPNTEIEYPFKLSKVVRVNRGGEFCGSQYSLTPNNLPEIMGVGYVL